MLTTVKHIGPNINNQNWELNSDIGHGFEDYVYKVIVKSLNTTFLKDITVYQTPSTRDDGRDIVIEASRDFELFGIPISLKAKDKIIVYIECKSSSYDIIPYDKFAKNTIIAEQDHVDYFVLITNKTITPFSYYSSCENALSSGYEFVLIDQYLLASYMKSGGFDKWNYEEPLFDNSQVALSYQVSKGFFHRNPCFELYLLCRNYSPKMVECELQLMTDWNWEMSEDIFPFVLDSMHGRCIKIKIYREYFEGLDDILIQLSFNKNFNVIQLEGNSLTYDFDLPLTGQVHKDIISCIKNSIVDTASFSWINLYGEAGVGKTRIIEEVSRTFWERNIKMISYSCNKNTQNTTFDSLVKYIKKVTKRDIFSNTLIELLHEINDEFLWTALFIEDIHNADDDFIKMLQDLINVKNLEMNILLITAGRDDYTIYNEIFFSMLEQLKVIHCSHIFNYQVKTLENDECCNLIKRVITEIPNEALNKIHKMSNNNPFFLVQCIEYLLETRMVNLLNRNTVGIPNILTFSKKLYIPNGIEAILAKRYDTLRRFSLGKKCQDFLMVAALYGKQFPKKLLLTFFCEVEYKNIEVLFQKHFLKYSDVETLQFDHESLYIYLKNLKIEKKREKTVYELLYENLELYSMFDDLKQGIILYKIKKYKQAKEKLIQPIQEIENMDNLSSENMSARFYEYFYYIYEIAKKEKNIKFMKKVILAKIYVAMHNLAIGQANLSFEEVFLLIRQNHAEDEMLELEIKQLQASYFLHVGMVSKARGIMNELLAFERICPDKFTPNIKFNLFERAASLYIHTNHISPAIRYNKMSFNIADSMGNHKLLALAKINEAKIWFFPNINKSYSLMKEAREYLHNNRVERIDCHNELGILTAEMILSNCSNDNMREYINRAKELLKRSIEVNYPLDIIRAHFLLAILYFLDSSYMLEMSKKHLDAGIDASIRYGILKLMGNYYNLKALIAIEEKQHKEYITNLFDTMIEYLKQEDLLFLGNLDFSYSNIILLTNYLIFLNEQGLESKKYQFLSQITYYGSDSKCDYNCNAHSVCHYTCVNDTKIFQANFKNIKEGSLLLVNPKYKFMFRHGLYYLPIYL